MKILSVEKNSTGDALGLLPGDSIVRINGEPVRDILDYRFLVTEEEVGMEVLRSGEKLNYEFEKDYDDDLGLRLEEIEIRFCGNDCPFCFVDQNPAGMRSALYFRDEDFRLSFLSGHYVTLTNLSKRDMDRIVSQRLSPLFVSVHATDVEVRKFLFGIEHNDRLLSKIEFLTQNDIEIHTQVVLCPDVNDGDILKKTIWDLANFLPQLKSVSVVPVGLTKHRKGLRELRQVTADAAADYLKTIDAYAAIFRQKQEQYFVYASDEFYLMSGQTLPPAERYDGFYQKENGVGMVRFMLDRFAAQRSSFPIKLAQRFQATFVTGTLVHDTIEREILCELNKVSNFSGQAVAIENTFYGSNIHVTGLLTGQDICAQLRGRALGDCVFLPANCVKDGQLFLDDWTVQKLSRELQIDVKVIEDFCDVFVQTGANGS